MNWLDEWAKIEVISFYIGLGVLSVMVIAIIIIAVINLIKKHKKEKGKNEWYESIRTIIIRNSGRNYPYSYINYLWHILFL